MNGMLQSGSNTNETVADVLEKGDKKRKLTGIWTSTYVQRLGIQDLCEDFLSLLEDLRCAPLISANRTEITGAGELTLMKMHLVLEEWAKGRDELREDAHKILQGRGKNGLS